MSAFQSTKCFNVLKNYKSGKCTHAYIHTRADMYTNMLYTSACTNTLSHTAVFMFSMGEISKAKIKLYLVYLFISWHCLILTCCLKAHASTPSLWDWRTRREGKKKMKQTNNKRHVSVSTSSLTCLTLLTWKWGKEGFGFNLNSKLCCWK